MVIQNDVSGYFITQEYGCGIKIKKIKLTIKLKYTVWLSFALEMCIEKRPEY